MIPIQIILFGTPAQIQLNMILPVLRTENAEGELTEIITGQTRHLDDPQFEPCFWLTMIRSTYGATGLPAYSELLYFRDRVYLRTAVTTYYESAWEVPAGAGVHRVRLLQQFGDPELDALQKALGHSLATRPREEHTLC